MPKIYRQNVAIVVLNREGRLLACERSDIPQVWQLPQGGIDEGETPEQAMRRELQEEIGTNNVEIIGRLQKTLRYDWPEGIQHVRGYNGQEQHYFLARLAEEESIQLDNPESEIEFSNYKWLTMTEFEEKISGFKKDIYQEALTQLQDKFPGIILR